MKRIDLEKINVARSNTVRNINRRIVLNRVGENAPISRSDIAKKTAMERSAVSLIVQPLVGSDNKPTLESGVFTVLIRGSNQKFTLK